MFAAGNLSFLRWIVDRSIDQLKWLALTIIALGAFIAAMIQGTKSLPTTQGLWIIAVVAVAAGGGFLWKGVGYIAKASSVAFEIKRFFYRRLRNQTPLGGQAAVSMLAAAVINEHFTSIRFRRRDQLKIAEGIVEAIRNGTKVVVMEGVSGAGKTATSLIAVDKLLTDSDGTISDYARRVLYVDLSVFPSGTDSLVKNCNSGLLHDACVIVDNFHRISSDSIVAFSDMVGEGKPQCRALLILTQPREFVTLSPSSSIDAFKVAEKNNAWFKLVPPRSTEIPGIFPQSNSCDSIAEALDNLGIPADDAVRWVAHASLERVFQIAKSDYDNVIRDLVCSAKIDSLSPRLLRLVAAVSALSIHRGVFVESDLNRSLAALAPGWPILNPERNALRREFRRLRSRGFVLEAVGRRRVFVFHQRLAEHFKDRFKRVPEFWDAFYAVGATLRQCDWVLSSPLMTWLYAVELGDTALTRNGFSRALCSGAYAMMRRALVRNAQDDTGVKLTYERGVLSEKVGDWNDARETLSDFVAIATKGTDVRAKAVIALVEAEHGPTSRSDLQELIDDPRLSEFSHLSARYWLIHLDAHEGRFDILELDDVLANLERQRSTLWDTEGYDFLHLARRAFFDRVRFHYLVGSCDANRLRLIADRPIAIFLSKYYVAFSAYRDKFIGGHSIHYDYIFQLGALGIKPRIDETILPNFDSGDLDGMIQAAIDYYNSAISKFSVFGDKTKEYIKPRLYEVKMMRRNANLDELLPDLISYKSSIEASGLLDLAPYPYLYLFKFHLKKAFETLLRAYNFDDDSVRMKAYDVELSRSLGALALAEERFFKASNQYGICMCRLFRMLMTALTGGSVAALSAELDELRAAAEASQYRRICTVADALQREPPSPLDVVRIVTYFPVVHQ